VAEPASGSAGRTKPAYRFGEFAVSCAERRLLRSGREVPLIPRYFDLLVLLIQRRHEAVSRRDILDAVWSDVVVSDGALTQAVRTLRRALSEGPREASYIRTVSRHGYQFVHAGVVESSDGLAPPSPPAPPGTGAPVGGAAMAAPDGRDDRTEPASGEAGDPFESALAVLLGRRTGGPAGELEAARREAAEALHALGTAEGLRRLDRRPGHEAARALLRDARWDVPGAGAVPLVGQPGGLKAGAHLVLLRLRRAVRLAGGRWTAASAGGAAAGAVGGAFGGVVLSQAPGSSAPPSVAVAMAIVGAAVGGLGAAGVGAGLAAAEALARSARPLALVSLGAFGGGAIGAAAHHIGRWTLEGVFGQVLGAVGGGFEGLLLGAAAGLGYALSTPRPGGGMATPHGRARLAAAAATGLACAVAGFLLPALGGQLAGSSLNNVARSFQGSKVGLAPLARLLGEPDPGPVTRSVIGAGEGLLFGFGLALGLTRRPR